MRLTPVRAVREAPMDERTDGRFYLGDAREALAEWREGFAGKVQAVYIDPPFATGQTFHMRVAVGGAEWRKQAGTLLLDAYDDPADLQAAEALLRDLIAGSKALLSETGLLYLHVDWRMSGRARKLLDEAFGEDHIVNEIIWSYQSGGRAKRYFSRKHDTIFLYRKGAEYDFSIEAAPIPREGARRNHMRRQVDADGRAYRTIRSGGKVYTYYDDEPVYPGDVWDDINMQQKDPQRTGFETQKPLKLLERILLTSTKPGDIVLDPCAGSGTTLEAAWRNGRQFLGADKSPAALLSARRRLREAQLEIETPEAATGPVIEAQVYGGGLGDWEMRLERVGSVLEGEIEGFDRVDGWALGYLRGDTFYVCTADQRSRAHTSPQWRLSAPVYEGRLAVRINDVYGATYFYVAETGRVEYKQ